VTWYCFHERGKVRPAGRAFATKRKSYCVKYRDNPLVTGRKDPTVYFIAVGERTKRRLGGLPPDPKKATRPGGARSNLGPPDAAGVRRKMYNDSREKSEADSSARSLKKMTKDAWELQLKIEVTVNHAKKGERC